MSTDVVMSGAAFTFHTHRCCLNLLFSGGRQVEAGWVCGVHEISVWLGDVVLGERALIFSDMGKEFLEALEDKAETVFDEFAKRYEILGIKFTKSYRSNARVWATVIALVLAFAINIDSVFVVNTYLTNQEMRQAVIGQESAIVDGYTTVEEQFEADAAKESITKEEFENAFADAQEELDAFTSAGFPIGWSYFPHTALQDKPTNDFDNRNTPLGWLTWVTGCVLTGLLAGLGGPFWYDFVAGVSHAAKSLRDQKG